MNMSARLMKPVIVLSGLLLVMPITAMADKPDAGGKGGKPNRNSVANVAACTIDVDSARVCSCKGLSNVVMWCGKEWVKHEDFGSAEDTGDVFDATVDCVDSEGNPVAGPIKMIGIKSGSQKNAKHHPEGYQTVEGAPSGSGLITTPEACSSEFVCPVEGDCEAGDEPPGDEEPPGEEDPPILY
jgi:hypothetical protein